MANTPLPTATFTQGVNHLVIGLAIGGQYIVPLVCVLGAILSAVGQHRRQTLAYIASQSTATT